MTTAPSVRVIVVNYNGGQMTMDCLRAVVSSDWPSEALQIVMVDNASHDGVAERVHRELPHVAGIRSDTNLGFAGGVQLGLRDLPPTIDYVALVNSDVTVPRDWLSPLVSAFEARSRCGVACPKILLADRYEAVELSGPPSIRRPLDRRRVTVRILGARVGGVDVTRRMRYAEGFLGPEYQPGDAEPFQWASGTARLLLPRSPDGALREVRASAHRACTIQVATGAATATIPVDTEPSWYPLPGPGDGFDVIHNIGTEVQRDGYARDRGYLERDDGQYDEPTEVEAWCGGAVLLAAPYVRSVGPLDPSLFAYYEDVDVSLRGAHDGWRYVTVPTTTIRHVHMATSPARAPLTLYLNERNRLLVLARHARKTRVAHQLVRFTRITASYFWRDVVAPMAAFDRPSLTVTAVRLRALVDACRVWLGGAARLPRRGIAAR